eukprot:SAG22_NODE_2173_length_2893_cov_3.127774_2_plen_115_part_00
MAAPAPAAPPPRPRRQYALGAPPKILELWSKGWEGHLQQYTEAKTVEVPMARDGMYSREFSVMVGANAHLSFPLPPLSVGFAAVFPCGSAARTLQCHDIVADRPMLRWSSLPSV